MVGINITISPTVLRLDQRHYIKQVAAKFSQTASAPVASPATPSGCLGVAIPDDSPLLDRDTHPYLSLIGALLWITLTRPDIATAVSRASSHSSSPTLAHWRAALRILRYAVATSNLGLSYPIATSPPVVSAYVDAAFGNESSRRSHYGFAIVLSRCLVAWTTKATPMVCLSTGEAEFVAATECCKSIMWLRGLLREIGLPCTAPSPVFEDNQACVAMVKNHMVTGRNRHFCIKMAWLRQQVSCGQMRFCFVPSKHNVADIFTKILPDVQFTRLRSLLMSPPAVKPKDMQPRGEC